MKTRILFLIFIWLGAAVPLSGQQRPEVRMVLLEPLAVYAEPRSGAEVSAKLTGGTVVQVREMEKGWLQISYSLKQEAWVASCFLKDGKYTQNVIFRLRPTAAASRLTVEKSPAGEKAVVLETAPDGFWKKVLLDTQFSAYVLRDALFPMRTNENQITPVKHARHLSTVVGRLLPMEKPLEGATHKLVYQVHDAEYLVAYVMPEKVNLNLWENWTIYLSGEQIWVDSIQTPFIKVSNIFPASR